jgi:hypothetical protein
MKNTLVLLFVLVLPALCYSQSDFRNGFVVSNQGDTLRGFVKYSESNAVYGFCVFKSAEDQPETTYTANQLHAYGIDGIKAFETKSITIEQNEQTLFIEVVVKGQVSLYKYTDQFWIAKEGGQVLRLTNEAIKQDIGGKRVLVKSNKHIAVLNMLMTDCAEIRGKIQRVSLTEKSLTKVVEDYNRCTGTQSITVKAKIPLIKPAVGFSAGLAFSSLKFESDEPSNAHLLGDFGNAKTSIVGISLDLLLPRTSERFSFTTGLLFSSVRYHSLLELSGPSWTEKHDVTIKTSTLTVPIGLRYAFRGRSITPYLNAGTSVIAILRSSSKWIEEEDMNNNVYVSEGDAVDIKSVSLGYWGGVGLIKPLGKSLDATLEIRYEKTNGISKPVFQLYEIYSNVSNIQILLGIRLR